MTINYLGVQKSLLRVCSDFISQSNLTGFIPFDFDSHGTINQLPDNDLIGVGELSLKNDVDDFMGTCYILVSTRGDDGNLVRLRPVVSNLFSFLSPGTVLPLLDPQTGAEVGSMKITAGVSILPVARTKTRPLQMVSFGFSLVANS